jgi:two-component system, LuxR family, response regulator FixJ
MTPGRTTVKNQKNPQHAAVPNADSATVFVVDDDEGLRKAIEFLLDTAGLTAKTFATGRAFLEYYRPEMRGCMLLDIRMPEISGLDFQEKLRELQINLPVILVSAYGTIPLAVRAMRDGAFDFIEKPFDDEFLLKRIREAICVDIDQRVDDQKVREARAQLVSLTSREKQVMTLVVAGKLNKQIAAELGISAKTVENHRARVMDKMGIKGLAELVHLANLLKLDTPSTADGE